MRRYIGRTLVLRIGGVCIEEALIAFSPLEVKELQNL